MGCMANLSYSFLKRSDSMTSFQTPGYLRREAALGKREDFERFLNLVPDVPAQAGDEMVSGRGN